MLIQISDPDKREYYELEAVNEGWTGRQLERQINSMLYERLLLSNDEESVLAVARKERIPRVIGTGTSVHFSTSTRKSEPCTCPYDPLKHPTSP